MSDLEFAGYMSYHAQADDPLRLKWNSVRKQLDVGSFRNPVSPLVYSVRMNVAGHAIFSDLVNHEIKYEREAVGADNWQAPMETMQTRRGDCEDIAILKYAVLLASGQPEEWLRLVIGEVKSVAGNQPHAWCASRIMGEWYALDNKFDHVIKVSEYINWLPMASTHGDTVKRYSPSFRIADVLKSIGG